MTKADAQMIKGLRDWRCLDQDSLIDLKEGVDRYPFCQTLQILYLLNLRKLNDSLFDVRLPHTAIHIADRAHLKHTVQQLDHTLSNRPTPPINTTETPLTRKGAKTISDFLRETLSQIPSPNQAENEDVATLILPRKDNDEIKAVPQTSTPTSNDDQQFLNELHRETLAKVNQRLMELRGMGTEEASELPKPKKTDKPKSTASKTSVAKDEIINRFIQSNPSISKVGSMDEKQMTIWQSKMKESLREDFVFVSETLANLYLEQGATDKAISVFEKLSLNYPEKSRYFAKLISQAKKNHNTLKSKK